MITAFISSACMGVPVEKKMKEKKEGRKLRDRERKKRKKRMEGKKCGIGPACQILIAQWMPTAECATAKDQIFSICGLMTDCSFHKTLKTTDSKLSIMQTRLKSFISNQQQAIIF